MGEPLAMRAKYVLEGGFYLWERRPWLPADTERFFIYSVSEKEHVIMDKENRWEHEVTVPTRKLLDPKFCLAEWYARKVNELRGEHPHTWGRWRREEPRPTRSMDTPLAAQAEQLLKLWGHYDNDPPPPMQRAKPRKI
ncbi:uncharacterized protein F5147DRAFT_657248 [Suillus discolor]|uniref:Uncharacterized protein n=1 Tax=Suillus discolor TaxID=1912936 RepID=A0A9P7EW84_9AGAM|nr:uncharacterized protein F5147DRAFT_657248 [Suillus discolor]KAG2094260.1 hypothetical protein F5147DRAFT_657248 [Suillus discolor]